MYDIGIGPVKLNDFLSAMNIPTINPHMLKGYEDEVAGAIEKCASESFENAVRIEKEMTVAACQSGEVMIFKCDIEY